MTDAKKLIKEIRSQKVGIYSERETITQALEYATKVAPAEEKFVYITAIMVYHNTLLEALAKHLEEEYNVNTTD